MTKNERILRLKIRLETLLKDFDERNQILNDPISRVLEYRSFEDREVAAFISAVFSYGRVPQILRTLDQIFELLGPHPALALRENTGSFWKETIPRKFKHRFNDHDDLGCLFTWLGEALRKYGTLEKMFSKYLGDSLENALNGFIDELTLFGCVPYDPTRNRGVYFLLPKPSRKSACKRLLLFLRWVAGVGPTDLGLWKNFPREILVVPLDTHVLRISKHLGFTRRRDNSWRTAVEITSRLKELDPKDPTRFDFALCHLGISQECPSRFSKKVCPKCRMNDLCVTFERKSSIG